MVNLKKVSDFEWEIPIEEKMHVPGKIFASDALIDAIKQDKTLLQVKNVAMLPGILQSSIAMPDAHQGYGFSIGGVAAFDLDTGVISPGGIGYDINCSVRLLKTNLTLSEVQDKKREIITTLFKSVPSGTGDNSRIRLTPEELNNVLIGGAQWAVQNGYGTIGDWKHTEENGKIENAKPENVSERAKDRGKNQLGTLGSGNHFLEVQYVDEVFNQEIANVFGIKKNQINIMIHCGSRGLGHQVASDYIQLMGSTYGWPEQDRELVYAPIKSELGQKYLSAMAAAANFGFANKQLITHWVRESMQQILPNFSADVVYDVCHNIAKLEKHTINGQEKEVLVCRKGATRSFGPGRIEIPEIYRSVGQPVLIPGSMGTASYILAGTKKSETFFRFTMVVRKSN